MKFKSVFSVLLVVITAFFLTFVITAPNCVSETDCHNGVDDDGDGATDCADSDCLNVEQEVCSTKTDEDCDGLLESDDPDCVTDTGKIYISEIQYHPTNTPDEKGEYVELENAEDKYLDVSGWSITEGSSGPVTVLPPGTFIPPRGFFLCINEAMEEGEPGAQCMPKAYDCELILDNTFNEKDTVTVFNDSGAIATQKGYDSPCSEGASIEYCSGEDVPHCATLEYGADACTDKGTPGSSNSSCVSL